jgi:hypothetical protein
MSLTHRMTPALARNMSTLGRTQSEMASRLCQDAGDDHVEGSPIQLRIHRSRYPLTVPPQQVQRITGTDLSGTVLIFGVGTGELVVSVLAAHPEVQVIAWDRDPVMLRLAMAEHDFSVAMNQGRLQWSLGEDLLDLVDKTPDHRIDHPLLSQVYCHEARMLALDIEAPRVLMCAGGLFVDDVAAQLEQHGIGVYTWEIGRLSPAALQAIATRLAPDFVFAINHTAGLAEACGELGLPLLVWEIDPATDGLRPVGGNTDHVHIHTYRASNVPRFRAAGFRHVRYTPLAANITKRCPGSEPVRSGPEVCFVGASMVDQARHFRTLFLDGWAAHHGANAGARAQGEKMLEAILGAQRTRPRQYVIPQLMNRHMADFVAAFEGKSIHDPVAMVAEMAAAERRLNMVARLGDEGIHVWGDPGWRAVEAHGVSYRGFAGHHHQLTEIYRTGQIHVDVNRLYQLDIVPMRVFDILACGGFLIAEHSDALAAMFDVGREIETWDSPVMLVEKVRYYKAHPEEAHVIAKRGLDAVRSRHSISRRVYEMLRDLPRKSVVAAVG